MNSVTGGSSRTTMTNISFCILSKAFVVAMVCMYTLAMPAPSRSFWIWVHWYASMLWYASGPWAEGWAFHCKGNWMMVNVTNMAHQPRVGDVNG